MRTFAVALALIALQAPNAAAAGLKPVPPHRSATPGLRPVPPSNSAANQYVEVVPTAGGGTPATAVPGPTTRGNGSSQLAALPPQTQAALVSAGSEGRRVAQLARATAPARPHRQSHSGAVAASGGGKGGGSGGGGSAPSGSTAGGSTAGGTSGGAPAAAVVKSLTGVDAGAGIGAGLPIALAIVALAVTAAALRRRRTS